MSKTIKTKIDGVPVELELLKVGPASQVEIERLRYNLAQESQPIDNPIKPTVKVLKVGTEESPVTPEKEQEIKEQVNNSPIELVFDLIDNLTVSDGKPWWKSKTNWANISGIVLAATALIGIPIHFDPEVAMIVYPVVLGIVNLFLRGKTKEPIKPIRKKKQKTA